MKNIYKTIFLSILNSVCIYSSYSQTAPGIEWQNTIGGSNQEWFSSIRQTSDGGYIVGGSSSSDISGDKTESNLGPSNTGDFWIMKLDAPGNIQWQNTIGGNLSENPPSCQQTSDGGYIIGGTSWSNISGDKTENSNGYSDYWVVKTDALGTIQWQNTIGASGGDVLISVLQTNDGGYILGGSSASPISGDKTENSNGNYDYWIVKINASGTIIWQNSIGGNDYDYLNTIQQTNDGGYILGGMSSSNISGDKTKNNWDSTSLTPDFWIVKTNASGIVQWENTIGGNDWDELLSIQQTSDNGYILGGYSDSDSSGDKIENSNGIRDFWIIKTDATGNIQWQNTIGGSGGDYLYSIQQDSSDGGYILGGFSDSNISGDKTENSNGLSDYWVVKTDTSGIIQWQKTIGGSDADNLISMQQASDGGFILGGYSLSNISGDKTENCIGLWDYWVVKLFPDTITGIHNMQPTILNPQFFPNPLTTQSKLTFQNSNNEKFRFTLFDITGRLTECVITKDNEIIVTKGSKPSGVYLFNLLNEKTGEMSTGKIVITD